jgi:cell division septum initiation protein DivIVA
MDAEQLIKQTSESVRAALEAAQRRADEIVSEAEAEAQRIRAAAESEARERLDEVRRALEQLEAGLGARSAPRKSSTRPKPQAAQPEPSQAEPPRESEPAPEARDEGSGDDAAGARLVAMKLALDGTARDDARKQLAGEYEVDDLDSLLDEVYAKAGK